MSDRSGRGGRGGGGRGRGGRDEGRQRSESSSGSRGGQQQHRGEEQRPRSESYRGGHGERGGRGGGGGEGRPQRSEGGRRNDLPLGPAPRAGQSPQPVTLVTNFFKTQLSGSVKVFAYHLSYDDPQIPDEKLTAAKAWAIFQTLTENADLGSRPLFDGKHTVFLLKPLAQSPASFTLVMQNRRVEQQQKAPPPKSEQQAEKKPPRKQVVTLAHTNEIPIYGFEMTAQSFQILEVFVKSLFQGASKKGRGIFDPNSKDDIAIADSDLVLKKGIAHLFHGCRAGLLLHSDIVFNITIGPYPLDNWLLLRSRGSDLGLQERDLPDLFASNDKKLQKFRREIVSDLKGKKMVLTHLGRYTRKIDGIAFDKSARNFVFECSDPKTQQVKKISVEQYFQQKYNVKLKYPNWPLVLVKRSQREEYYPMEVCKLEDGQPRKNISTNERREVIQHTKVDLVQRFQEILAGVTLLSSEVAKQKDIPLKIEAKPVIAQGRVLPCPVIIYRENQTVESERGEWKQPKEVQFYKAADLRTFHICYPGSLKDDAFSHFASRLKGAIQSKLGINTTYEKYRYDSRAFLEDQANELMDCARPFLGKVAFFVVILQGRKKNPEAYNLFKSRLELVLGLPTQFVMQSTAEEPKPAALDNIVGAMNRKFSLVPLPSTGPNPNSNSPQSQQPQAQDTRPNLGNGPENWRVKGLPLMDRPTCFIGIDVHHPPVGASRPSEAAISASSNAGVTTFYSTFRSQPRGTEEVKELKSMLVEAYDQMKQVFQNIVIIRDGLANSQFLTTAQKELDDLRDSIKTHPTLSKQPVPKFAYIIAQKRNICKLAVSDNQGRVTAIPSPGTVLDNTVTGTEEKDFYLVSQRAPQGVARPVRYFVFHDDLRLSLQVWQEIMYKLCYLHPGCNRAVSVPMPLYNAHKIAYRVGQVYRPALDPNLSETSSQSGEEGGQGRNINFPVNIPMILKSTHFYL